MNMLEIIGTNRQIPLDLFNADCELKEAIEYINSQRVPHNVKSNLRGEELLKYARKIDDIKAKEKSGNILVSYNNIIFFDLATLKIVDKRRIYTKDGLLKPDYYLIEQEVSNMDATTIANNMFYLREIAYMYFKSYRNTSSGEFCELINLLEKTENGKLLSPVILDSIYEYLNQNSDVNMEVVSKSLKKVNDATKKYIIRKGI